MSLDGLLTLIGLILAVFALAQPIQRRSVPLFAPVWFVIFSISISIALLIWRYIALTLGCEFLQWFNIGSMIGAFFFPIIGVFAAYIFWLRAKLTKRKNKIFRRFIYASYYEDKYDELIRIIEKNEKSLHKVLGPETLDLLFERKFVKRMVDARNWIHLRIFSNNKIVDKLPDRFRVTDNIIREFIDAKYTPLHSAIVADYGGSEYMRPTDEERELLEDTIQNPEWYMKVRIDYALIVLACKEVIASKKLDISYNQNDEWYIAQQGQSTRLRCPVYLAIKTHVIMLKKAIENKGEDDYYTSDLWNLFQSVCEHSKYNEDIWNNIDADPEYPTPFAYLMKIILEDIESLCRDNYKQGNLPLGRIGDNLIRTWATCVGNLVLCKNKVSDKFKNECIGNYLIYVLKMTEAFENTNAERKYIIKEWRDLLVEQLERFCKGDIEFQEVLFKSMNELDYGKLYIKHHKWLRNELQLKDKPIPT